MFVLIILGSWLCCVGFVYLMFCIFSKFYIAHACSFESMFGHKDALKKMADSVKIYSRNGSLNGTYAEIASYIPTAGLKNVTLLRDKNLLMKKTPFYEIVDDIYCFFNTFRGHDDSFVHVLKLHHNTLKDLISAADKTIASSGLGESAQTITSLFGRYNTLFEELMKSCNEVSKNSLDLHNLLLGGADKNTKGYAAHRFEQLTISLSKSMVLCSNQWNRFIAYLKQIETAAKKGESVAKKKLHEASKQHLDSVIEKFTEYSASLHKLLKQFKKEERTVEKLVR